MFNLFGTDNLGGIGITRQTNALSDAFGRILGASRGSRRSWRSERRGRGTAGPKDPPYRRNGGRVLWTRLRAGPAPVYGCREAA